MRGKLTRREFLQTSVRSSLVVAGGVTPAFGYNPAHSPSTRKTAAETGIATQDQEILRAAIDEIIPAGDGMPAASQVGTVEYLDRLARQIPGLGETLRKALRSFTEISVKQFQKDFASLPSEHRIKVLQDYEQQSSQDFPALRDAVYEAYYIQPRIWKLIGYDFHATNLHGPRMKSFDESALAEVRKKPKFYREVD